MQKKASDKIDYFNDIGKSILPDKYRGQVVTIFNSFPDNWYTIDDFHIGLGMSKQYARHLLEALSMARITERARVGNRNYYRYRMDARLGKP